MTTVEEVRPSSAPDERRPGISHSKRSRLSEGLISILILAILATALLSSVPGSTVKNVAAPVLGPVTRAAGLDQNWGMFAPNPPKVSSLLEVHVVMSDGEHKIWRPETDDSMPGLYWRKVKEEVIRRKEFRAGLVSWVVRKVTEQGETPARVAMIVELESLPLTEKGESKRVRKLIFDLKIPPRKPGAHQ